MGELTPTVQWAQRKNLVIISVKYQATEKPDFAIKEDYMTFKGEGVGISGKATYKFELSFYEPLQSDTCRVRFTPSEVEFRLIKKTPGVWPRLQASHERPHWIRLDFERWEYQQESDDEDIQDEGENPKMEKARAELKELEAEMKKQAETYETIMKILQKAKIAYLLIYNGIQWSGFILILLALLKCLRGGLAGILMAFEYTGDMMMFCHTLMLLEIVHSITGLTKSKVLFTTIQVIGRFLMTFPVLYPSVEIHDHPAVFYLFLFWTLAEVIRYPFYALSVLGIEVPYLTWLKYSAWIILYPMGFTLEGITLYLSLEHHDHSDEYDFIPFLPVSRCIRLALPLIPVAAYLQISYMSRLRKKKLGKAKTE